MGDKFKSLTNKHRDFINQQKVFFIATADATSTVNLSPKGLDSFRIVDDNLIIFLNKTGSGNETAAHLQTHPRMTIMFCSFDQTPMILRLYGKALEILPHDNNWNNLINQFDDTVGVRQIFALDVSLVQTSCGFGVPYYRYLGDRKTLNNWAENKGSEGIKEYIAKENTISLDGKPIKT